MANKILAAMGSNFMTAMHTFKEAFFEQTGGVNWDHRFSHAVTRSREERLAREQRRVQGENPRFNSPIKAQWFRYDPPRYGPRGCLTGIEKETFPEIGPRDRGFETGKKGETRGDIELWMSGGNIRTVPKRQNMTNDAVLGASAGREEEQTVAGLPPPIPAMPARPITSQEIMAQASEEDAMADLNVALSQYDTVLEGQRLREDSGAGNSNETNSTLTANTGEIGINPENSDFMGPGFNSYFESFMDDFGTGGMDGGDQTSSNVGQEHSSQADGSNVPCNQVGIPGSDLNDIPQTQTLGYAATTQQNSDHGLMHTQVAQDALTSIQSHLNGNGGNVSSHGKRGISSMYAPSEDARNIETDKQTQENPGMTAFNLGSSLLGKRKASQQNVFELETASTSNKRHNSASVDEGQTFGYDKLQPFEQNLVGLDS
nr:hypothetical protein CFP56_44434 [Quercus suber]